MTDLSRIAPPDALERLSFEQIRGEMLAALSPTLGALAPTHPIHQAVEVFAYRELYLRARINDAVKAALLPTSWGTNLDNIGARDETERRVLAPGDPSAVPPRLPVLEDDDAFRLRIVEAARAIGAGVVEAYESAARAAHIAIEDVLAERAGPAQARIWVLPSSDDAADDQIVAAVLAAIEPVRVLTDEVVISLASSAARGVVATLYTAPGPDRQVVLAESQRRVEAWVKSVRRIGRPVFGTELSAAATVPGVVRVEHDLADQPAASGVAYALDISLSAMEATWRV
jgi:phage-related baseplate assembly protein